MNQQNANEIVQSNTDTETVCEDKAEATKATETAEAVATTEITETAEMITVSEDTSVTEAITSEKAKSNKKASKPKGPIIWGIAALIPSILNIILFVGDFILGFLSLITFGLDIIPLYAIICLALSITGIVFSIVAIRKKAPKILPILGILLAILTLIPPILDIVISVVTFIVVVIVIIIAAIIFIIVAIIEGIAVAVATFFGFFLEVLVAVGGIVTALATIFASLGSIADFLNSIINFVEPFSESITTVAAIL